MTILPALSRLALATALAAPMIASAACGMLPTVKMSSSATGAPAATEPSAVAQAAPAAQPTSKASEPAAVANAQPATSAAGSAPAEPPSTSPAPAPEADLTPPAGMPDLGALIGPRGAGDWTPRVFAGLHKEMTPAEAGAVFAGAEKTDRFGFASVPPKGRAGVESFDFYFADGDHGRRLHSAKIVFARALNTRPFFDYLLKVATNKYGDADPEEIDKQLIVWMDDDYASATLQHFANEQYVFDFSFAS